MAIRPFAIEDDHLTMLLATFDEPNISSPSSCFARLISVLVTLWAFFEVARAITITMPARIRKISGVLAGLFSTPIMCASGSVSPDAI